MSANVETMFSVREVPWHGLGTVVQDAPDSEQALYLAGLDWGVEQRPVYVDGREVKGMVANVRMTDNQVLGIVTNKYNVVQNREAFSFVDELVGNGQVDVRYETAGSLAGGKKVWMLARMPEIDILGDATIPYLVFSNTHDGTGAVRVAITPIRVVCQNTLNLAIRGARRSWSAVHKASVGQKIEEARKTLELAEVYLNALTREAERLATTRIPDSRWQDILNQIYPIEEDATERQLRNVEALRSDLEVRYNAYDLDNFRGTAWGVMSAVSDHVTHMEPLRQTETYKERLFDRTVSGHPTIDTVYKLVTA